MQEKIIDGKNAILGRLSSYAAKQALLGNKVTIVNANEVIIIGEQNGIKERYSTWIKKGGSAHKGPYVTRTPERLLKRTIRGMLSYKQGRGDEAYSKIRCYNEVPEEYKETKKIVSGKEKKAKFLTLKELVKLID